MDSFTFPFCFTSEAHGIFDLEGRIEVEVLPNEFRFGGVEVYRDGEYTDMPDDTLGAALRFLIVASLDHREIEHEAPRRVA